MALTKLTTDLIDGSLGTDWVSNIQTSNFTAVASKGYFVNTTSAEITITLPVGVVGTEIVIQDYAGTFATNKVILASNGSEKIQGTTDDFKCVTNNATVNLVYQDATKGWTADNIETTVIPPLTVDYLVVAGGGSGAATHGGGGGAGGLRTSYGSTSGGGSSAETSLSLVTSTHYTVNIGAGGTVPSPGGTNGTTGSNSVFATITSTGGGWGEYYNAGGAAGSGGSGGGASYGHSGGSATANQGYAGGNGSSNYQHGGGGGGASQAGYTNTASAGGNGGNGLSVSITGSSVAYAGGGGGGINAAGSGTTPGSGGTGGGGNAAAGTGQSGTENTGGGGAGGYYTGVSSAGGSGGSGVVILRYPSNYTITVPAGLTSTTSTDGSDKVTTFTSGTGNIQFN